MPRLLSALLALLLGAGIVHAARIRYHYAPAGDAGCVELVPAPGGAIGERLSWIGLPPAPYNIPPRPNRAVCLLHPDTMRYLNVPLVLGFSTPKVQHWGRTLVYDYGSDTIEIHFLGDGSVEVIYNNGLLRSP